MARKGVRETDGLEDSGDTADMDQPKIEVPLAQLLSRPGNKIDVPVTLAFAGGFAATVDSSVADSLDGELVVEAQQSGLTVTGDLTLSWQGVCRRCLDDVSDPIALAISEIYEAEAVEGETYPLVGDTVNLAPMLREASLLALPLAPLCRDDCVGPAPDVFPTGPPEPTDAEPKGDPRWAALDALTFGDEKETAEHEPDGSGDAT